MGRRSRGGHYEEEIDPEEIFRMFFGGGMYHPHSRGRQQQQRHRQSNHDENDPLVLIRQFAPLLFVIFISMLTSVSQSADKGNYVRDYKFSFQQSYSFPHRLQTLNLN